MLRCMRTHTRARRHTCTHTHTHTYTHMCRAPAHAALLTMRSKQITRPEQAVPPTTAWVYRGGRAATSANTAPCGVGARVGVLLVCCVGTGSQWGWGMGVEEGGPP